jgi:plasmid stabilization system protein ParE
LLTIWERVAADDVAAANRLYERLMRRIRILDVFPEAGAPRSELHPRGRVLVEEPYLIYYRPLADGGMRIVRVLHGSRKIGPTIFR